MSKKRFSVVTTFNQSDLTPHPEDPKIYINICSPKNADVVGRALANLLDTPAVRKGLDNAVREAMVFGKSRPYCLGPKTKKSRKGLADETVSHNFLAG